MGTAKSGIRRTAIGAIGGSSRIPIEWMGVPAWRLPSGKALAEFALQAGFLAPLLLGNGLFGPKKNACPDRVATVRREDAREGGNGLR